MTDLIDYLLTHLHYGDPVIGGIGAGVMAIGALVWLIHASTRTN